MLDIEEIPIFAKNYSQKMEMPALEPYLIEQLNLSLGRTMNLHDRVALYKVPDNQIAADEVILNNGLGHSQHPAQIWFHHFRFRHLSEVFFYLSLKEKGKVVSPLHVVGHYSQRREIDFGLFENGRYSAVQIDGPSHNETTSDEERQKMSLLLNRGFNIIRVRHYGIWDFQWCNLRRDITIAIHHLSKEADIEGTVFNIDFEVEEIMAQQVNFQKESLQNVHNLHHF